MCLDAVRQAGQTAKMCIAPCAQLTGISSAPVFDGNCTGLDEAESAGRPHCQPLELVIIQRSIRVTLCRRQGSQRQPVGNSRTAGQLHRLEQRAHALITRRRCGWVVIHERIHDLGCGDHLTYAPARSILSLARREMRGSAGHFKHFATTTRGKMGLVPKGFDRICP